MSTLIFKTTKIINRHVSCQSNRLCLGKCMCPILLHVKGGRLLLNRGTALRGSHQKSTIHIRSLQCLYNTISPLATQSNLAITTSGKAFRLWEWILSSFLCICACLALKLLEWIWIPLCLTHLSGEMLLLL